jgi:hypothetical protein
MRIIGLLAFALLMAWPFAASAQSPYCDPTYCANPFTYHLDKNTVRANAKQKKVAVKKSKKPAKVQYMRIAP